MNHGIREDITQNNFTGIEADVRLTLIGKTGAGKSDTGNTLTGRDDFKVSMSASSVTEEVKSVFVRRAGRLLQVVDCPGFLDTRTDARGNITKCLTLTSPGPHAILYIVRTARFSEGDRRPIEETKELFGPDVLKYMIIIFTHGDELYEEGMTLNSFISSCPEFITELLALVNHRYLAVNNRASEVDKLRFTESLLSIVEEMVQGNNGSCYTMDMHLQALQFAEKMEEEGKQKMELKRKREWDEMERSVKEKYAKLVKDQVNHIERLQREVLELDQRQRDIHGQYTDTMSELKLRLYQTRRDPDNEQRIRHLLSETLTVECNENEVNRQNGLAELESRINRDIHLKEEKLLALSEKLEEERDAGEANLQWREDEWRRREEEHRRRIAVLEAERRNEQEVLRHNKLAHARSESDIYMRMETEQDLERRNYCILS